MKKIKIIKNSIAFVIAIIITITAIIMPEVFNKVNSSEITKMLSSKDYYLKLPTQKSLIDPDKI